MTSSRARLVALVTLAALLATSCKPVPQTPAAPEGWTLYAQDGLALHGATALACPTKIGELKRDDFGNTAAAKENPFCVYTSGEGFRFTATVQPNRATTSANQSSTLQDYQAKIALLAASLAQCGQGSTVKNNAEAIFNGWWVHLGLEAPCSRQDASDRLTGFESDVRARLMKTLPMRGALPTAGRWQLSGAGQVPTHVETGLACPQTLSGLGRVFYRQIDDEAYCHYVSNDRTDIKAYVLLPQEGAWYAARNAMQSYQNAQNLLGRVPLKKPEAYHDGQLVWYADPETANALQGGRCPTFKRVYAALVFQLRGWISRLEFELQCDSEQNLSPRFADAEKIVHGQMSSSLRNR